MEDLKVIKKEDVLGNVEYLLVVREWERVGESGIVIKRGKGVDILEMVKNYDEDDYIEIYKM